MNIALFYALNANSESNEIIIAFALCVSQHIPYFLMGYSILGLIFGDKRVRITLSVTMLSASVSALLSWTIGYFAYMPRPFIDSVGYNFLNHEDSASFPSNHMMFMTVFALIFLQTGHRITGWFFLVLALLIGWSRIFLGVHYPIDVAGGALIAIVISLTLMKTLRSKINFGTINSAEP